MKRLIAATEMVDLRRIMKDSSNYSSWKKPDIEDLQKEYNIEYKNHTIYERGDIWPTFEDFLESASNGEVITLTEDEDYAILDRSHTASIDSLISLVSNYRSWPEFRNMDTVADIITGFVDNLEMTMPIVLESDGIRKIFSGNTRLDIAFMLNVSPKVLIINAEI